MLADSSVYRYLLFIKGPKPGLDESVNMRRVISNFCIFSGHCTAHPINCQPPAQEQSPRASELGFLCNRSSHFHSIIDIEAPLTKGHKGPKSYGLNLPERTFNIRAKD